MWGSKLRALLSVLVNNYHLSQTWNWLFNFCSIFANSFVWVKQIICFNSFSCQSSKWAKNWRAKTYLADDILFYSVINFLSLCCRKLIIRHFSVTAKSQNSRDEFLLHFRQNNLQFPENLLKVSIKNKLQNILNFANYLSVPTCKIIFDKQSLKWNIIKIFNIFAFRIIKIDYIGFQIQVLSSRWTW